MSKGQLAGIPNYLMKKIGEGGGGQPRASLTDVIIPLLVEDWVENEDGDFVQTVAVNGLGAGNNPVVLLYTDAEEYTDEELEAYCRISDINVTQDAITFIASRKPAISFAVIAKSVTDVEGTEVALNRVIEKIDELTDIAVPLMVSDWVAEGDTFVQNITVNGLGTSNVPVIALSSVNEIASEAELDSYSCISDVIVTEGNIKFIASEMPSISFTVVVKGVVASESNTVADITALVGRVSELEAANSELNSDLSSHTHNYAGSSSSGGSATKVYGNLQNPTSTKTYFLPFIGSASSGDKELYANNGVCYRTIEGTTEADGCGILQLGNVNASGTDANKYGAVRLYSTSKYFHDIKGESATANRTITLPNASGTIALTSDVANKGTCTFIKDMPNGTWDNAGKSGCKFYCIEWLNSGGRTLKITYVPVDILNLYTITTSTAVIEYVGTEAIGQWCSPGTKNRLAVYPLGDNTAKVYGIE